MRNAITLDYALSQVLPARDTIRLLAHIVNASGGGFPLTWTRSAGCEALNTVQRKIGGVPIVTQTGRYRGEGLRVWGFSCLVKREHNQHFLIGLNTAHHPAAVAVALSHEIGHYLLHRVTPAVHRTSALMRSDLLWHMDDAAELFADSVVALSAIKLSGRRAASALYRTLAKVGSDPLCASAILAAPFRMPLVGAGLSALQRSQYLFATIHFAKLRLALFERAGV